MRNWGSKNRFKNILRSKPFLIFLFVVMFVFAWNVFGLWFKMRETDKNKEMVKARIVELEQHKAKLSAEITDLSTETGVEDSIRDKFGLAKEGEGLIVIVDEKEKEEIPKEANTWGIFSIFQNLFK